jgi:hypothetical protein
MLIEIIRQTSIRGQAARVGDRLDVDEPDAQQLLNMKRARVVEAIREVVLDQPVTIPAAVPAPEARSPRPRKPRQT